MVRWEEYRRLNRFDVPRDSCSSCQRGSRWQVTVALVLTIELHCIMVVPVDGRTKVTLEERKAMCREQIA